MNNSIERLESIKAGSCGAISAGIGYGAVAIGVDWFARSGIFNSLPTLTFDLNTLVQLAIAATGGFLC
jgi:hypothetical protein